MSIKLSKTELLKENKDFLIPTNNGAGKDQCKVLLDDVLSKKISLAINAQLGNCYSNSKLCMLELEKYNPLFCFGVLINVDSCIYCNHSWIRINNLIVDPTTIILSSLDNFKYFESFSLNYFDFYINVLKHLTYFVPDWILSDNNLKTKYAQSVLMAREYLYSETPKPFEQWDSFKFSEMILKELKSKPL